MIWSIFSKTKEPHILINELSSTEPKVQKEAYHELLNHQSDEADEMLMVALNSKDTEKVKKLAIISILGHRATEEALPSLKEFLRCEDKEFKLAAAEAVFGIGTPEAIEQLVKLLGEADDEVKQKISNLLSRIPSSEAMGALLRCVPEDKTSNLYFEIVSIMEELDLFDVLKSNFEAPDKMVKEFYFNVITKFERPDFIPLYLSYYPMASNNHKETIISRLREYNAKDLINYCKEYISKNTSEGITALIEKIVIPRYNEATLEMLDFVISVKDSKFKLKTLPILLKQADPYCYNSIFQLLKENFSELRELALNSLIELVKKTNNRISDWQEPNKNAIENLLNNWKREITDLMLSREELPEEYYKTIRKLFFEFCNFDHEMLQPVVLELVNKDFFETYYLLKNWSFEDKFSIYSWMIKKEPSFGSILLTSLNPRADETLWRLAIKLSKVFEYEEDSEIFRKNLLNRHRNISFERFLKDNDPGIRGAAIEIVAQLKPSGYIDLLKNYAKDPYPEVRKSALKSLLNDHNLNLDNFILESLDDPNEEIVLYLLQRMKTRIGAINLSPYLVRFVNSESKELRNYAKQEIAEITKERYKVNYNNMTPEMRKLAASAIQKIDNSFTDEIVNDLSSYDPQTRLKAALLLESIHIDSKTQSALLAAMKDPSKKVRAAIVKTLGIVGNKEIISNLINFFSDPDPRVRANTIEAISSLGDNNVVRILLPYLEDSNNRIRANAVVGICKFGRFNVTNVLQSMLADSDENMRASALWAIGEIGDLAYIPLTYNFMQDQNELIRFNAIKAISRINPQLLQHYIPILRKDNSQKIRNLVKELSFKLI